MTDAGTDVSLVPMGFCHEHQAWAHHSFGVQSRGKMCDTRTFVFARVPFFFVGG